MRILTLLLIPTVLSAQSDSLTQRAQAAYTASDWKTAAEAYATLAKRTPDQAMPHFRLGVSLLNLNRGAEAKSHLEAAERLGTPTLQASYRLAQAETQAGNKDAAFAQLTRATTAGMTALNFTPGSDPLLAPLKGDTRFQAMLAAMERNANPCLFDPRTKELDFWLGDWDLRPRGNPAATPTRNVITKIHDGCVLLESYTAPGYTGQSFNIRDASIGKWTQSWVDKAGGLHLYYGEVRNATMYYEGEMPDPSDPTKRIRTRVTIARIAADTLRQFAETTRDGTTWTQNYDFLYTRRR